MNLEKIFIEIAKDDLKSSTILYKKKQYRNSYFLFQQSIEKANKAFLLFNDISESDMKEIRHDQFKPYRREIEKNLKKLNEFKKSYINQFEELKNNSVIKQLDFDNMDENLKFALKLIDSLKNIDLINISEEELSQGIIAIKKLTKIKIDLSDNNIELFFKNIGLISRYAHEEIKDLLHKIIPYFLDLIFIQISLLFGAYITIQHSSISRYPEKNINPLLIYNEKLPIIKKFPEFENIFNNSFSKLENFIKIKEKNKH